MTKIYKEIGYIRPGDLSHWIGQKEDGNMYFHTLPAPFADYKKLYIEVEDESVVRKTQYDVEVRYHPGLISWGLWASFPNIDLANTEYDRLMEKTKHPLCIFNDVRIIEVVSNRRPVPITHTSQ